MGNWYAAPQPFSLMDSNYNLRVVGTFRDNRKLFDYEKFLLDKKCDRIIFKWLDDKLLGTVIRRCKYSKTLQVVSTTMNKGVGKVTMSNGRDLITVKWPNDITTY